MECPRGRTHYQDFNSARTARLDYHVVNATCYGTRCQGSLIETQNQFHSSFRALGLYGTALMLFPIIRDTFKRLTTTEEHVLPPTPRPQEPESVCLDQPVIIS